jgi:chitinase
MDSEMSDIVPIQSKWLVGYFPAEGHKQNYDVADIPAGQLAVIYAFAGIAADGGCVSVDTSDDKINFPQLRHLKHHQRNLQTLISVGGASNTAFPGVAESDEKRLRFAQTSVQFMIQNGFDGIDIDWEFPTATNSAYFTELLQKLRSQLDAQGDADGCHYLLTIAAPAGPIDITHLELHRSIRCSIGST